MVDGNLASGHPSVLPTTHRSRICVELGQFCPTNALFIHSSYYRRSPLRLPREKSSAATSGEDCSPPPRQVQINGLLPPKEVVTGASRPLLIHTSIENRPVHNIGSDGLSPHLNAEANRKQSNLFVYVSHPSMGTTTD
ncbi:hypothetical protein THAOC_26070 [Thalassiosira oceanica]|uniref:Uncharacterized protein n=1 Tax=Thalassiosira oceanica TaxID=159749 RepID=K0RPS2_THAOC|nr:hypothetical protein THAOC_26070 [Thalassiosira oceanica]|eukprot:EJK54314.1 hypothetical protein THAOC_26070 [Thalassiosira oceanica]